MRGVWRFSDAALRRCSSVKPGIPKPFALTHFKSANQGFARGLDAQTDPSSPSSSSSSSCSSSFPRDIIGLFSNKWPHLDSRAKEDLANKVRQLRDGLLLKLEDSDEVVTVLEEKGSSLFRSTIV